MPYYHQQQAAAMREYRPAVGPGRMGRQPSSNSDLHHSGIIQHPALSLGALHVSKLVKNIASIVLDVGALSISRRAVEQREMPVHTRTKKSSKIKNEEPEQLEEEDDDDEYYPVLVQQQSDSCPPEKENPVCIDTPQVQDQVEHFPEREDSFTEDQSAENIIHSPAPRNSSEGEFQRPQRPRKRPRVFTYDRLGSPTCYNMSALPYHTNREMLWTPTVFPYPFFHPYGHRV
ncbi:hypothetical protein G5714_020394 [Onychostoma macrolepis]|uniref:Uncharacterized protein n=1 Tax=Onychostoma macrolepis TaxID=369639 RepID=A0A7J6BU66_9TELE|nr:hypothetical protein G5714_020394 [Onychostoma macrolepis]